MDKLIKRLHDGSHSLVVENDGSIHTYDGRGVSDLYDLLKNYPSLLKGARIADKVVGKGAAALMAVGGVRTVYADLISEPALELLMAERVHVSFGKIVHYIKNRTGDGVCPVETLCGECATASECIPLIDKFIAEMRAKK
jgi:iron complex outermembrane receptor protein